jgi:hypothetical protein
MILCVCVGYFFWYMHICCPHGVNVSFLRVNPAQESHDKSWEEAQGFASGAPRTESGRD